MEKNKITPDRESTRDPSPPFLGPAPICLQTPSKSLLRGSSVSVLKRFTLETSARNFSTVFEEEMREKCRRLLQRAIISGFGREREREREKAD